MCLVVCAEGSFRSCSQGGCADPCAAAADSREDPGLGKEASVSATSWPFWGCLVFGRRFVGLP